VLETIEGKHQQEETTKVETRTGTPMETLTDTPTGAPMETPDWDTDRETDT